MKINPFSCGDESKSSISTKLRVEKDCALY